MSGRKVKRYALDHIVPVGFVGAGHRFVGDLVNISSTGMLVKCAVDVQPGAVLRAGIEMDKEMIRFGVVARRSVSGVGLGFKFSQMSTRDHQKLHHLLRQVARPQ